MGHIGPFRGRGTLSPTVPRYILTGTPNTSGKIGNLYGVILHGSRSGIAAYSKLRGDGSEGRRTITYVTTPGTTSYNWLIDYDGTVHELAGWNFQAWHAGSRVPSLHMNTNWYGVAFAQVDSWEPMTDEQYASAHWLLNEIRGRTTIPLVQRRWVSSRYASKGITEHRWTAQGASGGKSDVGDLLDWSRIF